MFKCCSKRNGRKGIFILVKIKNRQTDIERRSNRVASIQLTSSKSGTGVSVVPRHNSSYVASILLHKHIDRQNYRKIYR